jgi:hypothetical protein
MTKAISTLVLSVMLSASAFASSRSGTIDETLRELNTQKALTATALDRLTAYAGHPNLMSWETHAVELDLAKIHLNATLDAIRKLEERREQLSPAQRESFDSLRIQSFRLANSMQYTLDQLKDNRLFIRNPAYGTLIRNMAKDAFGGREKTREMLAQRQGSSPVQAAD